MWPFKKKFVEEKLNPVQPEIALQEGSQPSREFKVNYRIRYENIEIVNRAVNMVVDDSSEIPLKIGELEEKITPIQVGVRQKTVNRLLNYEPNPFQDISTFKRNIFTDFIVDGNAFLYFDGAHLYHLPACKMEIHPDPNTYISHYLFDGRKKFYPDEIIHVKDNSFYSIYRGISRLKPASRTMALLANMREFQDNFFKNGAIPGLVIKTPNTLSERIKQRLIASWSAKYNPKSGGRRPMILDGGMEVGAINDVNFKELDFQEGTREQEKIILKAIGVPPILFEGGNNANITPNLRLYYIETILPLIRKFNFAYTRYFGYSVEANLANVEAMQKDLKDQASYYSSLVNGGILTPNEARIDLGRDAVEGHNGIRIPTNVAGSAANPSTGGKPEDSEE